MVIAIRTLMNYFINFSSLNYSPFLRFSILRSYSNWNVKFKSQKSRFTYISFCFLKDTIHNSCSCKKDVSKADLDISARTFW